MKKSMYTWFLLGLALLLSFVWYFKFAKHYPRQIDLLSKPDYWGLTYSAKFAGKLGLDPRQTFLAVLDDLGAKNIRLPVYWDEIEATVGEWDFSDYDFFLAEGQSRDVKFVANVGWRLPRWPECHAPKWLSAASAEEIKTKTMLMLETVVKRYRDNPSIVAWQVENEPLLDSFGECPPGDADFLAREIDLVKNLDPIRPIIVSASGELSNWKREAELGDIFGTTMYRVVWSPYLGYVRYPWPPFYYQIKAKLAGLDRQKAIISELQTEPWVPNGELTDLTFSEVDKSFTLEQFRANLQFAINVDFKQAYLWGVEWWYWQKLQGRTEYWNLAKEVFNN